MPESCCQDKIILDNKWAFVYSLIKVYLNFVKPIDVMTGQIINITSNEFLPKLDFFIR